MSQENFSQRRASIIQDARDVGYEIKYNGNYTSAFDNYTIEKDNNLVGSLDVDFVYLLGEQQPVLVDSSSSNMIVEGFVSSLMNCYKL